MHHDEVVAYPNLLTLPIGKFANRVIRGAMQADRLLDCSSSLPTCLLSDPSHALMDSSHNSDFSPLAEATDSSSTVTNNSHVPSSSAPPSRTYLILPITAYNRLATSKPARIRRTRMKGTDRLVMKLKQLIQGEPSTDEKATSSNDSNDEQRSGETAAWVADVSEGVARPRYKYFWSRDFRSDPNLFLLGKRAEEADARPDEGTNPSSVTNGSTDEDDQRPINTERWHRPMRSCLPPQRLEVVDRDLEKALQRVSSGHAVHLQSVSPKYNLSSHV
ncbi:unnamed protein product [Dibothriocephalus latus]|uniref:Uncharacterized protein n=1 Tax=Dibothriocephalus latus TaxID=60516 RepID=A0A3P7M2D2_DIBLA|nr:unnamed protein product [Dibothriocephalus latus]